MQKAPYQYFYDTPPIWNDVEFEVKQFQFPFLDIDVFQPKEIPSNLRLGHKVEHLCRHLISSSDTYDILAHNLQIQKDKRTLGEIDFLLKNVKTSKIIHVELTYKFYLIDPTIQKPIHRLIGPNRRDSFFEKMQKIKSSQFPLLHTDEGIAALQNIDIHPSNIEHQCCFKAQIFRPYKLNNIDIGPLNSDCIIGYWVFLSQFKTAQFETAQYYMPPKTEWIIAPHEDVLWLTHDDIITEIEDFHHNDLAPMLWKYQNGEIEKIFVVWW